jgi:hypothetical protein
MRLETSRRDAAKLHDRDGIAAGIRRRGRTPKPPVSVDETFTWPDNLTDRITMWAWVR